MSLLHLGCGGVSDILRDHGGARRYLDISAYGSATLQAPDDSRGWDETGSASPVVCDVIFYPRGLGFYSPWDCPLLSYVQVMSQGKLYTLSRDSQSHNVIASS